MNVKIIILTAIAFVLGGVVLNSSQAEAYRGDASVKGPEYSEERHEAMTQAFENEDFDAWRALMGDKGKVSRVITQENFGTFVEAHNLMVQGKTDEAAALRAELGLGAGQRNGQGNGQGKSGGCPYMN
jgi:hypothetical protein